MEALLKLLDRFRVAQVAFDFRQGLIVQEMFSSRLRVTRDAPQLTMHRNTKGLLIDPKRNLPAIFFRHKITVAVAGKTLLVILPI